MRITRLTPQVSAERCKLREDVFGIGEVIDHQISSGCTEVFSGNPACGNSDRLKMIHVGCGDIRRGISNEQIRLAPLGRTLTRDLRNDIAFVMVIPIGAKTKSMVKSRVT